MDIITERLKLKDVFPDKAKNLITNYKLGADPDYIRKGLVAEKTEVDTDANTITSYITTSAVDRDKEIVAPEGAMLDERRISKTSYCHMGT